MPALLICIAAMAIDGDSIRCRNLGEVRLLAIDSADYRRSRPCLGGFGDHVCDDRKALAGKRSMQRALKLGPVRVDPAACSPVPRTGCADRSRDRYGRMVALASAGGVDLSCYQLRAGVARYIVKYDNGGRVRRRCGPATSRR